MKCFFYEISSGGRILLDSGIVAGYDIVAFQFCGSPEEVLEFQLTVAVNTWIGCQSTFIAMDKLIHDLLPECIGEIKNIKGHFETVCDASCIFHIVLAATGGFLLRADRVVIIKPHYRTQTMISGFLDQICGNRTVNTAAHSDQSLLLLHEIISFEWNIRSIAIDLKSVNGNGWSSDSRSSFVLIFILDML